MFVLDLIPNSGGRSFELGTIHNPPVPSPRIPAGVQVHPEASAPLLKTYFEEV